MTIIAIHAAKGIPKKFAPHNIVTGKRLNLNQLKAPFGDYIEANVNADVTNYMKGKTQPCISLGPGGKWQGLQICFDLETG